MRDDTRRWIRADKRHCWHPFTRQSDWCASDHDPLVIVGGRGAWLTDSEGRRYLDGNSSIWTNIHGHDHPRINDAIREQLGRMAHVSFLGLTHPGAVELAQELAGLFPGTPLPRVFFSDNGSTAVECALRMALQYRMQTGEGERRRFAAFGNAYHGDTLGAASVGGVGRFLDPLRGAGYEVSRVSSLDELAALDPALIAAVVIEPLIQGVNEMRPWPAGMLRALRNWCDETGCHLILDEVMTGFGRTGAMFACQREQVVPDFLCLAKGLTGGYLPLAATMVTDEVYRAFLGDAGRSFSYGHSYTAHALGCAAALASLALFREENTLAGLPGKAERMREGLQKLKQAHPGIHEVRQCGLIAGIELRQPDGLRFLPAERIGELVCAAARPHGLLTRPVLDTVVLMPPLCVSAEEIDHAVAAIDAAISSHPRIDSLP